MALSEPVSLLDDQSLQQALVQQTRFRRLVHVSECASTQDLAGSDPEPGPAVYWADHQIRGRGRQSRAWSDEPGQDLAVTFRLAGLRLPEPVALPAAVPLCIAQCLMHHRVPAVRVKWPNDVLIGGRKVAGVLIDGDGREGGGFLVGIGVNCNRTRFPPDLEHTATSVALATGHTMDRHRFLLDLAVELDACVADLAAGRTAPWEGRFRDHLGVLGRNVVITTAGGESRGRVVGLDFRGLRLEDGRSLPLGTIQGLRVAAP